MHAAGRPATAAGVALLLAVIVTAGCVSFHSAAPCPPQPLSPDEERLAQALAHYAQGLIYEVEGSAFSSNALQQFTEASRLDPSRTTVNTRAAVSALLQNRPEKAVEVLERSCRAFPESVDFHLDLATAYQLAGRPDDAARIFRKVLKLDPTRQNARIALANLLFFQSKEREALDVMQRGMTAGPESQNLVSLAYAQGARLYQEKKLKGSIACFEFVLRHATQQRHELESLIGNLYEETGRTRTALRYYRRATLDPAPVAQAFVKLAVAEFESSPARALAILADADRRLPDNAAILITTGQIHASQGRDAEALAHFNRVYALVSAAKDSKQVLTEDFYMQYALMLERAGQSARCEEALEQCVKVHPAAANALNFLAYTWAERGVQLEKSLQYVLRALKSEPDNGAFLDTLGWIYYRLGRHAEAALAIQRASELVREDPTILEHLGDVLDVLGCPQDAAVYWQRSLQADPKRTSAADRLRARNIEPAPAGRGDANGK